MRMKVTACSRWFSWGRYKCVFGKEEGEGGKEPQENPKNALKPIRPLSKIKMKVNVKVK